MKKQITLAYRFVEDRKIVEFWTVINNWHDALFFEAQTKICGFIPIFIKISKKEYRQLKKTENGFIKKYNDFMKEQMETLTEIQ